MSLSTSEAPYEEVTTEFPCDLCSRRGVSWELPQFNSPKGNRKALLCYSCGQKVENLDDLAVDLVPNELFACFYSKATGNPKLVKRHLGHLIERGREKPSQSTLSRAAKSAF